MLFNFIFRALQKHAFCETLFDGCSHYMLIVKFWMLRKPLNSRSSRREVFCKKKALKNFEKITGKHLLQSFFSKVPGSSNFVKKRLQHRCSPVKYAKFILQNSSGGINKKEPKFTVQLNEAFNLSLWNKTKNSSCSLNAENTVFVSLEPKIVDYDFLHSKWF